MGGGIKRAKKNRIGLLICNSTSQKITRDPFQLLWYVGRKRPENMGQCRKDDVLEGIRMYRVFALLDLNVCFHGFRTSILEEKNGRLEFVLSSLGYGSSCVKFRSLRLRGGRCLVAVRCSSGLLYLMWEADHRPANHCKSGG